MRCLLFTWLLIAQLFSNSANAQDNDILCTKGITYGELIHLFQFTNSDKLINTIQQKCFEEVEEAAYIYFTTYERKYERTSANEITYYNELLTLKLGKAYEYKCSEYEVCQKLLKQVNDNAIFYCQSLLDSNAYIYILKDKLHVIEMRDIEDKNIGYAYGFKYRDVAVSDLQRLKAAKLKDDFPKSESERSKLEYKYERVDSYNNPTSIYLNVGDKVSLEAGGNIRLGAFAGSGGPTGIEGFTSYCRVDGFKHGALLFRIDNSEWDAVNEGKIFVAKRSGNLQFIVNDSDPSNNSGFFWINIKIIRQK